MKNKRITIFTTYHSDSLIDKFKLNEVNCTRYNITKILFNANDTTLKNSINDKNKLFGEFVTMYYAYMNNIDSEYIGFEHYRRRFESEYYDNLYDDINPKTIITAGSFNHKIKEYFVDAHSNENLFDLCVNIINKQYGINNKYSDYLTSKNEMPLYFGCIFVCKNTIFKKMFKFIWDVITEMDKELNGNDFDINTYANIIGCEVDNYCIRFYGFLIERLISSYIYVNFKPQNVLFGSVIYYTDDHFNKE